MANYKNSVLHDNPITFWTFDYDQQTLPANEIIDEIGNTNPLYVAGTNYLMRQQALNHLEVTDQYCISINKEEKTGGLWSGSTTLEAPHSAIYGLGEFTLEFMYNKDSPNIIRDDGETGQYQTISSPLILKGGLVNVKVTDPYGNQPFMSVGIHNDSHTIYRSEFRELYDVDNHVVIRYKVNQVDVNEYESISSVFINGYKVSEKKKTHFDSTPVSEGTTSWLLASNGGSDFYVDYQTEELKLDQIAIYDYPISDEQISNHYRKTQRYHELILKDKPTNFWRFDEPFTSLSSVNNSINSDNGTIFGNHLKQETGTPKIIDTKSMYFFNGGTTVFGNYTNSYNGSNFIDTNTDYSVEFWFKTEQSKRGLLFSTMNKIPNWGGLNIYINSHNDFETGGFIQISESADIKFNSQANNYNDNKWHHIVVTRKGRDITLYIDGDVQGELEATALTDTKVNTRVINVMGQAPNNLGVDGWISELVLYDYTLQPIQINHRFHFATRHQIFGHTLLEGAPVQAKVRFYNTFTGEKVGEMITQQGTGEYIFYPYSNRQLDIVALIPDSTTTKYRVHAPITPAEFDDAHLQS
jgi:hypothetical protein